MKFLASIILLLLPIFGISQERNLVLVEHFTNTPCPICANNNPKVYRVIDRNAEQVHHISIHTNSPYPSCVLHNFNPTDNGARQNYYGAHSTPRVYVNGKLSSASQEATFERDLQEAMATARPLQISVDEQGDLSSLTVKVSVTSKVALEASNHRIFVALVEKLVHYDAPNGEKEHRDVLRDYVTSGDGDPINLPLLDETMILEYTVDIPTGVVPEEAYVMVYIQDIDTKEIMGSGIHTENTSNANELAEEVGLSAFPNPVQNLLRVSVGNDYNISGYEVLSVSGAKILQSKIQKASASIEVQTEQLVPGQYILRALVGNRFANVSFIKD